MNMVFKKVSSRIQKAIDYSMAAYSCVQLNMCCVFMCCRGGQYGEVCWRRFFVSII